MDPAIEPETANIGLGSDAALDEEAADAAGKDPVALICLMKIESVALIEAGQEGEVIWSAY